MKLRRKLAGLVSAAVVLSSLSTGAFAASPSDFSDMPNDWSRPALENAINNGLLNGSDGKINASGLLTRAELAAIVNRAFGATETADISAYTDVSSSAWYYADMQKAVHMGTFEGSGGKLSPQNAITRQEAFTVLARAFSLADGSASALSKFSDASAVSSWAKGPVAALTEAGYVNGSGGKLNPTASITRAEFAQIADNLVAAYLPKEYAGTTDGNAMVREAGAVLDKADIKGDLILGDGVGDGNVTIKDSKIAGRLVVRGGGAHSIIITGSTEIGTVVVSKVNGNVRVATEGNAKVQTIIVNDGKDDVIIAGAANKVEITSADVPVVFENAKVGTVVVSASGAEVTVDKNSTVQTITVDKAASNATLTVAGKVDTVAVKGDSATVTAEKGATIAKVETAAANTVVKGDGKVTKVEAQAGSSGVKVTTPGTSITVDKGAEAVTTDKGTVEPGKSGSTSGSSGGGGGGGGGSSSTTTETLNGYLPAPLAEGAATDYKVNVTKTSNRDYIDVAVTATDLIYTKSSDTTYHIAPDTEGVEGLWAGVAVPVPEKADAANTKFSWVSGDDWAEAANPANAFKVIDGKPYMVFYSDLSKETYETRLQIVWTDAEGNVLETQKFLVDYSGVTFKGDDPGPGPGPEENQAEKTVDAAVAELNTALSGITGNGDKQIVTVSGQNGKYTVLLDVDAIQAMDNAFEDDQLTGLATKVKEALDNHFGTYDLSMGDQTVYSKGTFNNTALKNALFSVADGFFNTLGNMTSADGVYTYKTVSAQAAGADTYDFTVAVQLKGEDVERVKSLANTLADHLAMEKLDADTINARYGLTDIGESEAIVVTMEMPDKVMQTAADLVAEKGSSGDTLQTIFDRQTIGTFLTILNDENMNLDSILGSGADEINSVLTTVNSNANLINKVLSKLTITVDGKTFITGTGFDPGTAGNAYHDFMTGVIGMTSDDIKAMTPADFKVSADGQYKDVYYAVPVTVDIDLESSMGFRATETVIVVLHIDFSAYNPTTSTTTE